MTDSPHYINSLLTDASFKLSCDSVLSKLVPLETSLIDLILLYNNPEEAEIVLSDGRKYFWYFAIASMINPISLYLRDLIPIKSYPAICLNHKIVFRGPSGMADIEPCLGTEFHGVVHLLSNEQMIRLDGVEFFYHRIKITCTDYQGQSHTVYVYQTNTNDQSTSLPHERYLDIIIKGCEYYKVQSEYINKLKTEQPVIPRKQPENFQSFTNLSSDIYYSMDDLGKHNGNDPLYPLWVSINGKILEYTGLPPSDHLDYEFQQDFYTFVKQKLAGHEIVNIVAKTLYEPLYKISLNDEDICDEHRARIEDHYYNTFASSQNKSYWKTIGRLRQTNNLS